MKHLLLILSMSTVAFMACDEKKEEAPDAAAAKPAPTVSATTSTTATPTASPVATTTASAVAEPIDAGKSDAGKAPKK